MAEEDSSTPQYIAARIRAEAAGIARLSELYAGSEQARIAARRQILELEEQALEIGRNLAKTKEQQLKADEKLKQNAHAKEMLAKREADIGRKAQNDESSARAAALRSEANDVRRSAELHAKTDKEKFEARRRILELERQALELDKQRAMSATGQIAVTEKLKQNAHATTLIRKEEDELAEKQNSTLAKMSSGVSLVGKWWQEAAVAVYAMVSAIQRADDLMEQGFKNRAIMGNLPFEINSVRESTLGLVSDYELARVAITANRLGVAKSGEEYANLAEAGTMLGLSVGQDATKSVEDLTTALARGSPLILDNLGISLSLSKAYELYAQKVGTTVSALTAEQKAEAFRVIGMEKALEASDRVKISVTEQEQAWIDARREYDQLVRETLPQLTARMGGMWQVLGDGAETAGDVMPIILAGLDHVGRAIKPLIGYIAFFANQWGLIGRVFSTAGNYLGRAAGWVGDLAGEFRDWLSESWVGDAAGWISETGSSIKDMAEGGVEQLTSAVEEHIPYAKEMEQAYATLKGEIFGTHEAMSKLLGVTQAANTAAAAEVREKEATRTHEEDLLTTMEKKAAAANHMVALAEAQNRSAKELELLYQDQHQAKVNLLLVTGDQAALEEQMRDEEVRQAKAANKKRGGGGSGPTDADRMRATGEIQLALWEDQVRRLEIEAGLRGTLEQTSIAAAETRHRLAVQTLELERQVLEITRAKNSVERERNAARIEQIQREIDMLADQQTLENRQQEVDLIEKAVAETQKRADVEAEIARQDAARMGELIQLSDYRFKREEQAIRHRGELAQLNASTDLGRLAATQQMERDLHQNRLQQMRAEREAELRELAARQAAADALPAGTEEERLAKQDEQRQVAHDQEVSRLDYEMEVRRAMEAEKVAMLQREQARQEAYWAEVEKGISAFEGFRGQVTELGTFFSERNAAEQDAELQRTVQGLEARGAAQKAALDREIAAAKGNTQKQHELRQRAARQEAGIQRQIEQAQAQHADRKKRQEMRAAGAQLMITGVVETVKAVVAFAGQNYVEGALHLAAAATAFTQGGFLLSGKIPGGGAANASGGAAAAGGMSSGESQSYADPSNVPGSIPGEAARRESATAHGGSSSKGGTVINFYGDMNSLGTIDEDAANNIGRQLAKTAYSRQV